MMKLTITTEQQLVELMSWFASEGELAVWAGPNFSYPFDLKSFKRDLKLDTFASFSMLSSEGDLLAFGQYYLRLGKCHLSRLVVNPRFRGKGLITSLINQLSVLGHSSLNTQSCSLFVLAHNTTAINAYVKLGFCIADYPDKLVLENCLYMVQNNS